MSEIQFDCINTIIGLLEKYKDSDYMTQRLKNHIINYLPNTLETEFKSHEERVNRNTYLTNEQQFHYKMFYMSVKSRDEKAFEDKV